MNNFKKIVSLFLFGMMASPMSSMDFNIVDVALDKNKPTSFLGMMALYNKIEQEKQQQAVEKSFQTLKETPQQVLEKRLEALNKTIKTTYKEFDKDEYTSEEVCRKTKFLAYITTFGEKERFELSFNSKPSSPNTIACSPRSPKSILKTSLNYIPKKK